VDFDVTDQLASLGPDCRDVTRSSCVLRCDDFKVGGHETDIFW
jgi:hypothetical protein